MMSLLLFSALMAAEPDDKQLPLLKTFREEFILVTPGHGRYPKSFTMGSKGSASSGEQPAHRGDIRISISRLPSTRSRKTFGKR